MTVTFPSGMEILYPATPSGTHLIAEEPQIFELESRSVLLAPAASSSGRNERPRAGRTPRVSKRPPETMLDSARSGSSRPEMTTPGVQTNWVAVEAKASVPSR